MYELTFITTQGTFKLISIIMKHMDQTSKKEWGKWGRVWKD